MAKDPLVVSAIENWFPRFVTNGIDINDFKRTTESITTWDEWYDQWSNAAFLHEGLGIDAEKKGHHLSAAGHFFSAALNYHFGKYLFVHDREKLKEGTEKSANCYRRAMDYFTLPAMRLEIPFEGTHIVGNYRRGTKLPSPLVIIVPGLDSTKEEMHRYEDMLLARGMSTLAIDGPGQGETEFKLPIYPNYEVVVTAVIDYISKYFNGEFEKVGVMGISLGGYYACRAASFEKRLAACVGVSGPYDLAECWDKLPNLTRTAFQVRSQSGDMEEAKVKAEKLTLKDCAKNIECHLLIVHGHKDRLFPIEQPKRLVSEAKGETELLDLKDGNHVCNNVPYLYRPYAADWLAGNLSR